MGDFDIESAYNSVSLWFLNSQHILKLKWKTSNCAPQKKKLFYFSIHTDIHLEIHTDTIRINKHWNTKILVKAEYMMLLCAPAFFPTMYVAESSIHIIVYLFLLSVRKKKPIFHLPVCWVLLVLLYYNSVYIHGEAAKSGWEKQPGLLFIGLSHSGTWHISPSRQIFLNSFPFWKCELYTSIDPRAPTSARWSESSARAGGWGCNSTSVLNKEQPMMPGKRLCRMRRALTEGQGFTFGLWNRSRRLGVN